MTTLTQRHTLALQPTIPTGQRLFMLPALWFKRSAERQQLRRDIGWDPVRIQQLEADIGLASGTLEAEMSKRFWQA
ncbi:hypothetical protein [Marinobacter caseinilyticus]|uniref:hypothetical protein n=1 Tax=Marinobacter caseinilyticus TaxID=2692195 RepID=UPI00140A5A69|nr:hypothetical protein [Marinobacter caseinilyticus]